MISPKLVWCRQENGKGKLVTDDVDKTIGLYNHAIKLDGDERTKKIPFDTWLRTWNDPSFIAPDKRFDRE